jgi:hypothetical protein
MGPLYVELLLLMGEDAVSIKLLTEGSSRHHRRPLSLIFSFPAKQLGRRREDEEALGTSIFQPLW